MNKKIISFVLILSLVVSMCPFTAFASSSHADALVALGVATDQEASADKITRSAFVAMAVRMSGVNLNLYAGDIGDLPFTDVDPASKEYPYVKAAYDMGIINGNGAGTFGGGDSVTLHQAVKMLVTLLGYKEKAEAFGGYPYGYMKVAQEKDLLDGISDLDATAPLTSDVAHELIMYALESTFVSVSSVGEDIKYAESDNMYMSKMLGIYKITGVVEQNEHTSLYGRSDVGENQIAIGSIRFNVGDTDAADFIGYYVDCYFKEINGSDRVVYIKANDENNSLKLTSRDIDAGASSLSEICYTKDGEDLKAKLGNVILIKNGTMATLKSAADLCPKNGDVTLISNDGDKVYDVAIVRDFTTIVAGSVSVNPGSIRDAITGSVLALDAKSNDYKFSIELNGSEASLSEISKYDVISYYEIGGEIKAKKLFVSSNTVAGAVEGIEADKIVIDGKKYYAAASVLSEVTPGEIGNFFVDIFGTVVHFELMDEISVYGYITKMKKNDGFGGVKVRIFTENDRWVDLDVLKKVKLNDEPVTDDDFYAAMNGNLNQLVSYRVNAAGKLTALTQAKNITSLSADEKKAVIENDEFRYSEFEGIWYRSSLGSLDNACSLSNDAKIFFIPADPDNEEEFFIGGKGNLGTSSGYTGKFYNQNETRVTDLLVMNRPASSSDTNVMIYYSMGRVIINNEEFPCIYGSYGTHGDTCVYIANEQVIKDAGTLNHGDVVKFTFNEDGRASAITKVRDINAGRNQQSKTEGYNDSSILNVLGKITSVDHENYRFTVDCGATSGDRLMGYNMYLSKISVYDLSEQKVYEIPSTDLMVDDEVVILEYRYQARAMVAFRD